MDRIGTAAYMLYVSRQAMMRADALQQLGSRATVADIARVQVEHERQLSALTGMLSYWIAGGVPVESHPPPGVWARLRIAWAVLRG